MKYFILASLCLTLNAQAATSNGPRIQSEGSGGSGYSSNTGFHAPGSFFSPTGAPVGPTNVIPNQTSMNDGMSTTERVSVDQMNTAPTPAPSQNQSNRSFGTTLQTDPIDLGRKDGPATKGVIERQAQEDSMDYSTTPKTTNPRPSVTPGRAP